MRPIAKGATELRIAPNWHPKAIGRIAVYALECPRTIHLPVARSQSPCRFRSAASASRSATKGFETRKFVASKRLRADGRSTRCSMAALRKTPSVPVFGMPLLEASSRPADSSISRRTSVSNAAKAIADASPASRSVSAFAHFETEALRALPGAIAHEPHLDGVGRGRARNGHSIQMVHVAGQVVAQLQRLQNLFIALVLARGFLELHLLAQAVARMGDGVQQRAAAGPQEVRHAGYFVAVLLGAYHLLARPETHAHFAVDATGVFRRGLQVFLAAAHLEEVEELRFEALGGRTRPERPEVQPRGLRQVGGDVAARELVSEHDLHVGRHAELDQVEVGFGEVTPRLFVGIG